MSIKKEFRRTAVSLRDKFLKKKKQRRHTNTETNGGYLKVYIIMSYLYMSFTLYITTRSTLLRLRANTHHIQLAYII